MGGRGVELPPPCHFLEMRLKSQMWTAGSKQGAEKTERRRSGPKTRILADYDDNLPLRFAEP